MVSPQCRGNLQDFPFSTNQSYTAKWRNLKVELVKDVVDAK